MWQVWFGWPDGSVWGNLAANAIWMTPTAWWGWRALRRHLDARHETLLQHLVGEARDLLDGDDPDGGSGQS